MDDVSILDIISVLKDFGIWDETLMIKIQEKYGATKKDRYDKKIWITIK